MIALTAFVRFSKKSQKHRKDTPRFQLWRTTLASTTKSIDNEDKRQMIGYKGYEGSAAAILVRGMYRERLEEPCALLITTRIGGARYEVTDGRATGDFPCQHLVSIAMQTRMS